MKKRLGIAAVLLGLVAFDTRGDAQQTPDWGSGVAPFAFAFIASDLAGCCVRRRRSPDLSPKSIATMTSIS